MQVPIRLKFWTGLFVTSLGLFAPRVAYSRLLWEASNGRMRDCASHRSAHCGERTNLAPQFPSSKPVNPVQIRIPITHSSLNLSRLRISFGETVLMAARISSRTVTGGIQLRDLIGSEVPADGPEICAQLRFLPGTDDERGHGRSWEQPVECDLRNGLAGFRRWPAGHHDAGAAWLNLRRDGFTERIHRIPEQAPPPDAVPWMRSLDQHNNLAIACD